jgi:hypothetical protein
VSYLRFLVQSTSAHLINPEALRRLRETMGLSDQAADHVAAEWRKKFPGLDKFNVKGAQTCRSPSSLILPR